MEAIKNDSKDSTFKEIFKKKSFAQEDSLEYKEYRKKWLENPKNNIIDDFPIHLDIESTSSCNLKCPMCFQSFDPPKPGFMNFDLYKKLIDEGVDKGLSSIKLQYRGEPLLHPKIVEMVKYAKDKGIIEVMFNTNATLLTEEKSKALIKVGLDKIICSVDGFDKQFYEQIRRGGNFNEVVNNIKRLQELKRELNSEVPIIRVQMIKLKRIKDLNDHIEKYNNFWSKIVDYVAVEDENDWDYSKNNDYLICNDFQCTQPWQRLFVMWDGEIRLCCGDLYGELVLGNAKNINLVDVWHSTLVNNIRQLHLSGKSHLINICKNCGGRKSIIINCGLHHTREKCDQLKLETKK